MPRIPFPLDTGAKIRTFNLAKNIAERHRVTLLSFLWKDQQSSYVKELEKYFYAVITVKTKNFSHFRILCDIFFSIFSFKPLVVRKYFSRQMKNKLLWIIKERGFDVVHFDHLHMAQYLPYVKNKATILDEHNVEHIIWGRYCEAESNFFKKAILAWQQKKMRSYEKETTKKFSLCLTVSIQDMKNLKTISPNTDVAVINNGVDINYFRPIGVKEEPYSLVFTGSMNWLPNQDAMIYFINDIYPLIKMSIPDVKLYIVGQDPKAIIKKLAKKQNIILTGLVDDVRPYLNQSEVVIVPLRIGGGTRLKILEAMAMQKPIVSTSIGHEGIAVVSNENIITADRPEDFAKAIIVLFKDQQLRIRLGENGRKLVEEKYSWEKISLELEKNYISLRDRVI